MRIWRSRFFPFLFLAAFFVCLPAGCGSLKDAKKDEFSSEGIGKSSADGPAFYITMPKIGKADSAILYMGGSSKAILIDAGEEDDGAEIVSILDSLGITKIAYMVITHFDKDHMGGAPYILENCKVGQIIQPAYSGSGKYFSRYQEGLGDFDNIRSVSKTLSLSLGEISLKIYPKNDLKNQYFEEDDDNNRSLVTFVTCQGQRFLFSGDMETERIQILLDSGMDLSCDWVKLPHHGSYYVNLERFLMSTGAREAVICCSQKNPASEETLALLEKLQISVHLTSEGDITYLCDGSRIVPLQP